MHYTQDVELLPIVTVTSSPYAIILALSVTFRRQTAVIVFPVVCAQSKLTPFTVKLVVADVLAVGCIVLSPLTNSHK